MQAFESQSQNGKARSLAILGCKAGAQWKAFREKHVLKGLITVVTFYLMAH